MTDLATEVDDYLSNIKEWTGVPDVLLLTLSAMNDSIKTQQTQISRLEKSIQTCTCNHEAPTAAPTPSIPDSYTSQPTTSTDLEERLSEVKNEIKDDIRKDIVELKSIKTDFLDFQKHVKYTRGAIEDISRDMMMKSDIKDLCTLLDVKANVDDMVAAVTKLDQ
jgi:hypothetical protein